MIKNKTLELAESLMLKNADDLKKLTMQDLEKYWVDLVGTTAPKWSSKQVAADRILKEATNTFMSAGPGTIPVDFGTLTQVLPPAVIPMKVSKGTVSKTIGRPPANKKVYTFIIDVAGAPLSDKTSDSFKRLPKQAKVILQNIKPGDYPEKELHIHVMALHANGKLTTKQDPWRIFQYYRSSMIQGNFLTMKNESQS